MGARERNRADEQSPVAQGPARSGWSRLGWFILLWCVGVLTLTAIGLVIRFTLNM